MRVAWDNYLEGRLLEAVKKTEALMPRYTEGKGKTKAGWWDAVAGVFYADTGTATTGDAVRKRWAKVNEGLDQHRDDAWARVTTMVEQYEADIHDATYALAEEALQRARAIEGMLKIVCRELGVEPGERNDAD